MYQAFDTKVRFNRRNLTTNRWSCLMPVDTEGLAQKYRAATVDVPGRKLLITNLCGTEQQQDLTEPPNCGGFGRIRHFRRATSTGWPPNPLPIDPACARLALAP